MARNGLARWYVMTEAVRDLSALANKRCSFEIEMLFQGFLSRTAWSIKYKIVCYSKLTICI